jgi:hypothetical protein
MRGPGMILSAFLGWPRVGLSCPAGAAKLPEGADAMTLHYTIGLTIGGKSQHVTVEAEDALIAALRVKARNPEAAINYVRKTNTRGDRRHPQLDIGDRRPV